MDNRLSLTYLAQVRRTRRNCAFLPVLTMPQFLLLISTIKHMALFKDVVIVGRVQGVEYSELNRSTEGSLKVVKSYLKTGIYTLSLLPVKGGE